MSSAARTQDRSAQAARLDEVGPLLAALVRRLGLPGERADQLQAVKAHLLEVLERFDPAGPAQFSTWVTTVASRFLLMELRRKRPELVDLDDVPLAATAAADPAAAAEARSLEAALERALERLPSAQRRAFVLASVEGLPLDEVATLEDVPVGTIKSRLSRARVALAYYSNGPFELGGRKAEPEVVIIAARAPGAGSVTFALSDGTFLRVALIADP